MDILITEICEELEGTAPSLSWRVFKNTAGADAVIDVELNGEEIAQIMFHKDNVEDFDSTFDGEVTMYKGCSDCHYFTYTEAKLEDPQYLASFRREIDQMMLQILSEALRIAVGEN
ncbi:hypothetical protein BNJ_00146 [Kaumoebavirus]|uniref:hypothetical protein n=1 Tax=Kaumoebavirus TaxID=1859492 RepID=UPI0009C2049B|nr:hypothetical protein BNJ_00146 [Kaumoebavirus]ARA71978.1 hypothetical protein BNJ_00146 [Kaumoebavirus]